MIQETALAAAIRRAQFRLDGRPLASPSELERALEELLDAVRASPLPALDAYQAARSTERPFRSLPEVAFRDGQRIKQAIMGALFKDGTTVGYADRMLAIVEAERLRFVAPAILALHAIARLRVLAEDGDATRAAMLDTAQREARNGLDACACAPDGYIVVPRDALFDAIGAEGLADLLSDLAPSATAGREPAP